MLYSDITMVDELLALPSPALTSPKILTISLTPLLRVLFLVYLVKTNKKHGK